MKLRRVCESEYVLALFMKRKNTALLKDFNFGSIYGAEMKTYFNLPVIYIHKFSYKKTNTKSPKAERRKSLKVDSFQMCWEDKIKIKNKKLDS